MAKYMEWLMIHLHSFCHIVHLLLIQFLETANWPFLKHKHRLSDNMIDLWLFLLRGRSQTTLTSFWLFLTTHPSPFTFSTLGTLIKIDII